MSEGNSDVARRICVVQGQDGFSSKMVETDCKFCFSKLSAMI